MEIQLLVVFDDIWSFLGGIWGKSIFMKKGNCWTGFAQRWQKKR
jgi:hypothetical protein